ncbi:protein trichome birefringence-like 2 [Cornus florida]|uniref:protein trichome birefringence-like 2 n=1 Tax=Cornus florida TaxID=4283 RepID=UPI0028967E83|nr:protein trichome birefringence-like 2 [Cornus florida]
MVRIPSAMDLKKLAFPDQFPYSVSPRRKVVSGFGLGVLAFFIVLCILFFNISYKVPIFHGFNNNFGANNTSIISWPFSFSSTASFSSLSSSITSSSAGSSTTSSTITTDVSEIGKNGSLLVTDGNGMVSKNTHVGNFSGEVKNGSAAVGEGMVQENTQVDEQVFDKNGNSSKSNGEGMVLENTHLGNFSEKGRNGSFVGGDVIGEKGIEGKVFEGNGNGSSVGKVVASTENPNVGKSKVTEYSSVGNLDMNNQGIGKNNVTISTFDSQMKMQKGLFGECDIFDGRWVRDDTKPYYPSGSCPYIDRDFDCHLNRRPDDGFLKWKWQPYGCDIPSLNATDFLERLRGRKLVFVGDSLNRNMWESLVCILRHSVKNKKGVYEISGRTEFKKKGIYAFRFEEYNCSVDFVSSPFLVRESSFNGRNGSFETLRLDLMDQTTSMYHDADVVIFNTGHWWTHEKTSRGEDYYQEGNIVYPRLKVLQAYKKALSTWARWVDKNFAGSRTQVIFRGYSVTHFKGGQWNSGGQCHKEIEPIFNKTYLAKYPSKMRALEPVLRKMRTPVIYLNISRLTDYRKDGHPSIYRKEYTTVEEQIAAEQSQDCSHWCLPGVPDAWNELLYASLLRAGKGSWRS